MTEFPKSKTLSGFGEPVELETRQALEAQLREVDGELRELPADADPVLRAFRWVDRGRILTRMERGVEAWENAREAFDVLVEAENWQGAVEACDVMFEAEQADSLRALGHGIWLAVTYPVEPEVSALLLRHLIEESPRGSDTAAVAAATAHYVATLRGEGKAGEELRLFTAHQLAEVAEAHSGISNQGEFDAWVGGRLGLDEPGHFLPVLGHAVDRLVDGDWWIDRDLLRSKLPVH